MRAVAGQAEEAAGTPVGVAAAAAVGSAGFGRKAGCVGTAGTEDNCVRRSCCHWRMGPSKARPGMKSSYCGRVQEPAAGEDNWGKWSRSALAGLCMRPWRGLDLIRYLELDSEVSIEVRGLARASRRYIFTGLVGEGHGQRCFGWSPQGLSRAAGESVAVAAAACCFDRELAYG